MIAGLVAAAMMMVATVPARAGEILPGSPKAALAARLIALETESWRFYKEKNVAALTAMTSDDFADLYSSGEVVDRARWLADMKEVTVERSELGKWHAFELADDTILLTYEGKAWGKTPSGPVYNHAAVTSAWAWRDGHWINVFYGEAALEPESVFYGTPAPTTKKP